jgi:YD repeat-containing protein
MAVTLIGGNQGGVLDSSLALLNRNEQAADNTTGAGEQLYVNVSNGNLIIQHRDVYLPSLGADFNLVRTYNLRSEPNGATLNPIDADWTLSTGVRLTIGGNILNPTFQVNYGDGSVFDFHWDGGRQRWVSTNGSTAFETIQDLGFVSPGSPKYVLTRADQTKYSFDASGKLLRSEDTNGVRMTYTYAFDRLTQVRDDLGHTLNYLYDFVGKLWRVTDETQGVLVEYQYNNSGRLSDVIDRMGHRTRYFYTNDGALSRIELPTRQDANGDGIQEVYADRVINIEYASVSWPSTPDPLTPGRVVKSVTDAEGGLTTFDYDFDFDPIFGGQVFDGGSSRVVDALGNNRAYSNEQQYKDWRVANGYYQIYNPLQAIISPSYQAQVEAIRNAHSLSYTFGGNGYITSLTDQQGYKTQYTYDVAGNLTSSMDRNGWGTTTSDSDYYRSLRAQLGYLDSAGNGKLVANLTNTEKNALREAFTSHFTYDSHGNLLESEDNNGSKATFTYTSFDAVATVTSATGNALTTSDDLIYQEKRQQLGYAALVANLSAADKTALKALYTRTFTYNANQNLIEQRDPGGDLTRLEYDAYGNVSRRIVFLDANDLTSPAKQQITQYFYDGFGNNIEIVDAEGNHSFSQYDHFGNRTRFTDANGGITTYTYDRDNRLLTVTDPEGSFTANAYDAVGNRISVTDAKGHTIISIYDRNNRLVSTIDPSAAGPSQNHVTSYTYDVVGNQTAVTDAEGRTTKYTYNARHQLVEQVTAQVTAATSGTTQYHSTIGYDGEGKVIRSTDNRGFTTELIYNEDGIVSQRTDPNGQVTRFVYDASNNRLQVIAGAQLPVSQRQILKFAYDEEDQLTQEIDAMGQTKSFYTRDAVGNVIGLTDANGHRTDYEFDRNSRVVKETRPTVTDPQTGQPTRYVLQHRYDAKGNQIELIDENGHSTRFSFDKDDRLVLVEDANGVKTVYSYDSNHNRTSIQIGVQATVDANRHVVVSSAAQAQVTTFTYDEFNRVIAQTDGVGNALVGSNDAFYQNMRVSLGYPADANALTAAQKQTLRDLYTKRTTYDRVGNALTHVDNQNRTTQFFYDALDRIEKTIDATGGTTTTRYDGNDNVVSATDANSHTATFTYDSVDRLTQSTDAAGVSAQRVYDSFGNVLSETAAAGSAQARTKSYVYNLNNWVVSQTDPELHAVGYEYDFVGNRVKVTDARGNASTTTYDAMDRVIKVTDPSSFETRFEYDGVGNRIALIDANSGKTKFTFDAANRLVETSDAEGRSTQYTFDVRGNRVQVRTAAGTPAQELTTFEYDAENKLRKVTDALGNVTTNGYDRVYNLTRTTDGNGNATVTAFDALNRAISVTNAEGEVTSYQYDAVGNRLTRTDGNGNLTRWTYDPLNRVITELAADGVESRFAYDSVSNRIAVTAAANTASASATTFVYDKDNRLVSQTDALGHTTSYEYDANNNRTKVTDANGHVTLYTYDVNNRVTRIQDPVGNAVAYRYDGNGNRVQVVDGRGFVTTSYYNADNEILLEVDAEGYAKGWTYDGNGNVVTETQFMARVGTVDPATRPSPASSASDRVVHYEYDKANRVTARIDGEGFRAEYGYDAVGNRVLTRQFRNSSGTDVSVTRSFYDHVNRETDRLTGEGYLTRTTYDDAGHVLTRTVFDQRASLVNGRPQPVAGDAGRVTSYSYDAVYRLVRETSPLNVVTRTEYDARGNRVAVTDAFGTADARRSEFTYDTANRLTDVKDANGVIAHYTLDADGNIVDRYDAYGTSSQRLTHKVFDGNHRVIQETNAIGVVTSFEYDANGNLITRTSAVGLPEQRVARYEYDHNNRINADVNGEGDRTESTYDGAGNRIRLVVAPGLPEQQANDFEYDRDNRLVATVDGEGMRTTYRYDGSGNKLETTQAAGLGAQERHSAYVYDLDNHLVQVTDPMGGVTHFSYDVLGNQTSSTDARGGVQTNTFDARGQLLTSLSAGGILTVNTYDLRGNKTSTTQSFANGSDARLTTYKYDLLDRQTVVTNGEGFSTSITYDAFGNQLTVTHGRYLLNPSDAGYDAAKAARAVSQVNTFTYDSADRMLSMKDGEANVTTYTYDALGNRKSQTEASNSVPRTTLYDYDRAGRVTQTITPEGGITRSEFNHAGMRVTQHLLQSANGGANIWIDTHFEYDQNGQLTASIDPYGVRTENDYDAMGNLIATRTAAGTPSQRTVRMEYDLNNRKIADIDGENNRKSYSYDAAGNRTKVTDALGRVARYYYDASNKLIAVLDPEGAVNTFSYDSAGNSTDQRLYATRYTGSVSDTQPPSVASSPMDRISHSDFDKANRAIRLVESDGATTLKAYDGAGNVLTETLFANTSAPRTRTYAYDLNNRLSHFVDVDGTETFFTWDGANNKTSERIVSASDPNSVRLTEFQYDLNNRLTRQTFDPSGLALVQLTAYDKAGNILTTTDANGHATMRTFDLANRVMSETNAKGETTHYGYDAVGNRTSVTDGRNVTRTFVFDHNNRMTEEHGPTVLVFDGANPAASRQLVVLHRYDALGNEVQTVDAAGGKTTRYFDSSGRKLGEITADDVLVRWTYNTFGEADSQSLYMTRLPSAAHDPLSSPASPAGEVRTKYMYYDLKGRMTRTVYPAIDVTAVTLDGSGNPVATTTNIRPEDRKVYDAFGNAVETFDRNGNRTVAYYDSKDRVVAQVDGAGYLIEWEYDAQDNILEQRTFATRLNAGSLTPGVRPVGTGEVHTVSRRYDTASHMVQELSPYVNVNDSNQVSSLERILTTFTYDKAGNQTSRTRGAGTSEAATEYYYYDAANRKVGVINANRVVHSYEFDANGNTTKQTRFYAALSGSVDLSALNGDTTDFSTLVAATVNDQTTIRVFDAANHITSETDVMNPSTSADDIGRSYQYNALGNQTSATDGDGFTTTFQFDAMARMVQNITADGNGSSIQYDAAGNRVFMFTGQIQSTPQPATNVTVQSGENLVISWNVPAGTNARSWVVWDSASHADINAYASRSAEVATWFSNQGKVFLPPSSLTGSAFYFRVVTADAAGNLAYTSEKQISLPPRLESVDVTRTGADSAKIIARAAAGAQNLVLKYGPPGTLGTSVTMTLQSDGSYVANLTGVTNLSELAYRIDWQDAGGASFSTNERTFRAPSEHFAVSTTLGQNTVSTGSGTEYTITLSTRVPASLAQRLQNVTASYHNTANPGAGEASAGVTGTDNGDGTWTFNFTLGSAAAALPAGTYSITLTGVYANASAIDAHDIVLDQFEATVGTTPLSGTRQTLSWTAPAVGVPASRGQLVLIDGVAVPAVRDPDSNQLTTLANVTSGSHRVDAFYGETSATTHDTTLTSTEVTESHPDPANPTGPPIVTVLGYDVGVALDLASSETASIDGDLHLAWRPAGSDLSFAHDVVLTAAGDHFSTTLSQLAAGNYDLKLYYTNADGEEVVVDWLRIDAQHAALTRTSRSLTVLASEVEGSVSSSGGALPAMLAGVYSGPVAGQDTYLSIAATETGLAGGTVSVDGSTAGYFTESQYNALNQLIGTNSDTGLWRTFGVDANGNKVATYVYGEKNHTEVHDSYTQFDARNRKITEIGVATDDIQGASGLRREITHFDYDAFDHEVFAQDGLNNTMHRTYNALGSLLTEQDKRGGVIQHFYDRLGNETRTIDARNYTSYKAYDAGGRLVQETNGAGNVTEYGYDVFDRRTQVRKIGGTQTIVASMAYDQHDRMVSYTDAMGFDSSFTYDKRDNRTSVTDGNGHTTYTDYNELGRVKATRYMQNGQQVTESRQYDAYGNVVAEVDGAGRTKSTLYGAFGRKVSETDASGRQMRYEYDAFGNVIREYRPIPTSFSDSGWSGGLDPNDPADYAALLAQWNLFSGAQADIHRTYDAAGRLKSVQDIATGVSTTYQYDVLGHRAQEDVTGTGGHDRHIAYLYDAAGQMVRWADTVTGMHVNYEWDATGNQQRTYTDNGYARPVDHRYEYDGANRVLSETDATHNSVISAYHYDAVGNRDSWNNKGVLVAYQFDANGRVTHGSWNESGANWTSDWTYDDVGNVLTYTTRKNGSVETQTVNQYTENYLTHYTKTDKQETFNTFDLGQRLTNVRLVNDGSTSNFAYYYYADGREQQIVGSGAKKASGTTKFTYDANDKKIRIEKGKGDGMDRAEVQTFVYSNDGQILYAFHDEGSDDKISRTEYQYANGNPVGERKTENNGTVTELLDTGKYNLVNNLGDDFPTSSVSFQTVVEGDTLQSIAARVYGNPSLWFVLAEANGLDPSQPLKVGSRITVPNTIESGAITADTHVVYSEQDIIGSTLPNLKTPKKKGCGNILAIIIVVIIAVVVAIYAPYLIGALGSAIGGLLGGGAVATFIGTVVAAAIVGAAASIVQQGLLIAMGYQAKFNWGAVGQAALTGALTAGVGAGIDKIAGLAQVANATSNWAKVARVALDVSKAAAVQLIQNGKITSWTSLAAAALGSSAKSGNFGDSKVLTSLNAFVNGEKTGGFVTPWLQAAESYAKNGKLTPNDWASAVGSTFSASFRVSGNQNGAAAPGEPALDDFGARFNDVVKSVGQQVLISGALAFVDRDAAAQYFASALGQEVGSRLKSGFDSGFAKGQERAREAERLRNQSAAGSVSTRVEAGDTPVAPVQDVPQASNGEQPFDAEEMEAQFRAANEEALQRSVDALGAELDNVPIDVTRKLKSGENLWALAKEDLGPGATNAQIQARAQQYMEVNGISDPRRLKAGAELKVPTGTEEVQAATVAAYGKSDAELRVFYQEKAAAQAVAAAKLAGVDFGLSGLSELNLDLGGGLTLGNLTMGGGGMGLWTASGQLRAGDWLMKDPAAAKYFMEQLPAKGIKISDYYKFDLDGKLADISPEYFKDLQMRRDIYWEKTGKIPGEYAIPEGASVAQAEAQSKGANGRRNAIMEETRDALSPQGKRLSEAQKAKGLEWDYLAKKQAEAKFGTDYEKLSDAQKVEVNKSIVESAASRRLGVDAAAAEAKTIARAASIMRGAKVVGRGMMVVGAVIDGASLTNEVIISRKTGNWENTAKEGTRIAASWGMAAVGAKAGAAGGAALGATIGSVVPILGTAVGAAAGAVIGGLAGGAVGYFTGSKIVEHSWSSIKSGYNAVTSWFD